MRRILQKPILLILLLTLVLGSGCQSLYIHKRDLPTRSYFTNILGMKSIYLVSQSYHSNIILKREDIQDLDWPELEEFKDFPFIEVGWGDKDTYMSPSESLGTVTRALLLPSKSVLHIAGLKREPIAYYTHEAVLELRVSRHNIKDMVTFIKDSFQREKAGQPAKSLGFGLYEDSKFYPGNQTYHIVYNCNNWAAEALTRAGIPVRSSIAWSIGNLFRQAVKFGRIIPRKQIVVSKQLANRNKAKKLNQN